MDFARILLNTLIGDTTPPTGLLGQQMMPAAHDEMDVVPQGLLSPQRAPATDHHQEILRRRLGSLLRRGIPAHHQEIMRRRLGSMMRRGFPEAQAIRIIMDQYSQRGSSGAPGRVGGKAPLMPAPITSTRG